MIAVVAGGTGLVGRKLIETLSLDPRVSEIRALARDPSQLPSSPKLKTHPWSSIENEPIPGDIFYCSLGTTLKKAGSREAFRAIDFDLTLAFAKMGLRAGAKTFALVSAKGASRHSLFFYSRVKGELENSVSALGYPEIIIVRPGLLIGDRTERRPAERLLIRSWRALQQLPLGRVLGGWGTPVEAVVGELIEKTLPKKAQPTL